MLKKRKSAKPAAETLEAPREVASVSEDPHSERQILEVVEETAHVTKRVIDRGSVKISKIVTEHVEVIPAPTIHEEIDIEHVAREVWLDRPAKVRTEGDTVIIPVMEEVIVTEKRLLLREEIYVRRRKVTVPGEEEITLRKETVTVEDDRNRTKE
jgi:uncharacterized protein (TIGR02271 family)